MFRLRTILPAAVVVSGILLCTTASYGTVAYATSTKTACTFCHEKATSDKEVMKANSTAAGKYYKEKKTSDGYTGK
jgi:cytochrome c553